jgi:hypothetical protein
MALFRVSTHVEEGYIVLRLNDNCITRNTGVWEVEIEAHTEYIVQWFVQGRKGSSYTITISNPNEAEFHLTCRLGNLTDFGGFRFIS